MTPEADVLALHRMERASAACAGGDLLADRQGHRGATNRFYYVGACREFLTRPE